jgi:antitoxin YefM
VIALNTVSYSELRQNLAKYMDLTVSSRDEVMVTRQGAESVVMMSVHEYESMVETMHLLSSPANAKELLESLAQADAGEFAPSELVDKAFMR